MEKKAIVHGINNNTPCETCTHLSLELQFLIKLTSVPEHQRRNICKIFMTYTQIEKFSFDV